MGSKTLKHKIIDYLLWHSDKVALKELFSGELYVKVYTSITYEKFMKEIKQNFVDSQILFEEIKQEAPFINDGIDTIELMISFISRDDLLK